MMVDGIVPVECFLVSFDVESFEIHDEEYRSNELLLFVSIISLLTFFVSMLFDVSLLVHIQFNSIQFNSIQFNSIIISQEMPFYYGVTVIIIEFINNNVCILLHTYIHTYIHKFIHI